MEYSKDIIIGVNYTIKQGGQANIKYNKFIKLLKKHKLIATILTICGILMILDFILVHNFIQLYESFIIL